MKFEQQFREWLEHKPYTNVEVRVEPSLKEQEKLGAIKALSRFLPDLAGNDVIIIAGDNLFTYNLKEMVEYYERIHNAPVIAIYDVGNPKLAREFSNVKTDEEGRILSFEEKPEKPQSTLIGTCIYIIPPKSLGSISEYLEEGNNSDSPGHFILWLSRKQAVYGHILTGYWCDIGTLKGYEDAKRKFGGSVDGINMGHEQG